MIVGASYIALETAGFLKGLGIDVTVMVRSILLRGFDQQMAEKIGEYMETEGINFIRPCVPSKIEQIEAGSPGKLRVVGQYKDGTEYSNEFNTVLFAVGRTADTDMLNLDSVGVKTNPNSKKIVADPGERSSNGDVYAIGDVLEGRPILKSLCFFTSNLANTTIFLGGHELTPVAIQAGKLLARRLVGSSQALTDYDLVS